jgi:hypothetical protein
MRVPRSVALGPSTPSTTIGHIVTEDLLDDPNRLRRWFATVVCSQTIGTSRSVANMGMCGREPSRTFVPRQEAFSSPTDTSNRVREQEGGSSLDPDAVSYMSPLALREPPLLG